MSQAAARCLVCHYLETLATRTGRAEPGGNCTAAERGEVLLATCGWRRGAAARSGRAAAGATATQRAAPDRLCGPLTHCRGVIRAAAAPPQHTCMWRGCRRALNPWGPHSRRPAWHRRGLPAAVQQLVSVLGSTATAGRRCRQAAPGWPSRWI